MKSLFDSIQLKHLSVKNRLVRSATWEGIASPDGNLPEEAYEIYEELAGGGVGTVITGFTSVAANDHYFDGMMRLCDDALIPQYKRLTDLIHAHGAVAIAQLALGAYYRPAGSGRFQQAEPDDIRSTAEALTSCMPRPTTLLEKSRSSTPTPAGRR